MVDTNTILLGIVIVLVFIWRFARTRQLYLTSLHVQASGSDPIPFKPHDLGSFIEQALLGRRSLKPTSFFFRGFVFVVVAGCLLPFKDYWTFDIVKRAQLWLCHASTLPIEHSSRFQVLLVCF
jgi:hypothetical protein